MKRFRCLHAFLSALALLGGCGEEVLVPDRYRNQSSIVIQAVLICGRTRQKITVTPAWDPEIFDTPSLSIDSVACTINGVRLTRYDGSVDPESPGTMDFYDYYSDSLDVRPDRYYTLSFLAPGHSAEGITRCPSLVTIGCVRDTLKWSPAGDGCLYRLEAVKQDDPFQYFSNDQMKVNWFCWKDIGYTVSPGKYRVIVFAFDRNCSEYMEEESRNHRCGVTGNAYGVFGCMSISEAEVIIE